MGHQDVSFRFKGGVRVLQHQTHSQMTQLALILLQLPSRQLNCKSTQDKWPQKWLYHFKFCNSQSEPGSSNDYWIFPLKSGGHFALAFRPWWRRYSAICSIRYVGFFLFCFLFLFFSFSFSFYFPPPKLTKKKFLKYWIKKD